MHETILADAFRPPGFTVLGLELADYAIGHELALWRWRNPLICLAPTEIQKLSLRERGEALALAVQVCAKGKPGWRWAKRVARMDMDAELEKFCGYLSTGMTDLPTVRQPKTAGVPFHYFGAPDLGRLLNYVTQHQSFLIAKHFEGSPLAFPIGLARVLYATHLECEGAIWVENPSDAKFKARSRAFDKKNPDGGLSLGADAVRASAEKWNAEHPDCPVPVEPKEGE